MSLGANMQVILPVTKGGIPYSVAANFLPHLKDSKMKKQNSTIVNVSVRKIDRREEQAKALHKWFSTLDKSLLAPVGSITTALASTMTTYVQRLDELADVWPIYYPKAGELNCLVIRFDNIPSAYDVYYGEHVGYDENGLSIFNVCQKQIFNDPVDAFTCFKARVESKDPSKAHYGN